MYRLLKVSSLCLASTNASKRPASSVVQTSYLCSFCKFYHPQTPKSLTYQQLKYYSATVKPSEISTRIAKKLKRKNSKYVEIMEVTNVATNKRTKVKSLNAANLSQFVEQNVEQEKKESYKTQLIRNIEISHNNSERRKKPERDDAFDRLSSKAEAEYRMDKDKLIKKLKLYLKEKKEAALSKKMEKDVIVEKNAQSSKEFVVPVNTKVDYETMNLSYNVDSEEAKKVSRKPKRKKTEVTEILLENRQENLYSFFQTCTNCGKLKQAFDTFLFLNKSNNVELQSNFKNVKLYNLFLREFALKGDLKNVKSILKLMNDVALNLNPESYAAVFECVARSSNPAKEKEFLVTLRSEMADSGICLNDIVIKPTFYKDQLKKVLEAVRLLEENFTPRFYSKRVNYNCHLLENVYKNRRYESPAKGLFQLSDLKERAKKQLKIEFAEQVKIKSIAGTGKSDPQVTIAREKIQELDKVWKQEILKGFERSMKSLKAREKGVQINYIHPYLTILEPEDYVNVILNEVKMLSRSTESFSPTIIVLSKELAMNVFKKYEIKMHQKQGLVDNIINCYDDYCKWYLEGGSEENSRIKWQLLEKELKKKGSSLNIQVAQWSANVMREVGKFLYDIILKDLKINVSSKKDKEILVPAFYSTFKSKQKQVKEEIKPHPVLSKLYHDCQPEFLTFNSNLLPSLAPPKPWSSVEKGGYLINKSAIIRVPYGFTGQLTKVKSKPKDQLYPSLDCLNQLGSIPWKVNKSILDVAIQVFQNGGSVELNVPEPPSVLPQAPMATEESTYEERYEIAKSRAQLKRRKHEMYSLWCDALYKLSLANHYKDEIFWLPHNMDFRGRVYPIPPHLSQMGSDFARSMLIFAQEKPLGPKGLDWLKIHVINLTGFKKKESIQDRLAFANEILDKILDSAKNPLTGEKWWTTSDDPWQTLAACMEISKALDSPNPSEYLTGFPVHQDGSCNGLQHYAALGRDQFGAESVNLCPFEKPRDVYSDVVVLVEKARKADAENGEEIAQVLDGYIHRKVIKQTIMTTVYGVTKYGARLQISKQLKDLKDFPEDKIWPASSYLVGKTFQSLRTMFKSAKEIQDWFTECAKLICTIRQKPVEWDTALGLPVVQPYFKSNIIENKKPNVTKQKNAFPPNFVHSLDSTHMMLTSLYCEQAGITFMSVHDCFWTHPCTVSIMNEICRQQFISLHSEPILENLSNFLLEHFKFSEQEIEESPDSKTAEMRRNMNQILGQVPSKGTYDLKKVQSSTYFFS